MRRALGALALAALFAGLFAGPAQADVPLNKKAARPVAAVQLNVVATAYNATRTQTDGSPNVGAWGDRLDQVKDARVIAVSPDLLRKGLRRGQRLRIHGLRGEFVVLDKMPKRWKNHIDIFMGKDIHGARRWGRQRVRISWVPEHPR